MRERIKKGDEGAAAGRAPDERGVVLARLQDGGKTSEAVSVAKAFFIGEESGSQSRALIDSDKQGNIFTQKGALPPVYDPMLLTLIFENSSVLRPNVDAYVTNIDSFGHTFEPVIDLDSEDAREKVRDALRIERAANKAAAKKDALLLPADPTDAEVDARIKDLQIEIRAERAALENFFENCTTDMPFSGPEGLRGLTRQDIEVIGSGYWEILRNELGEIAAFNYMPARSIRLMPTDKQPVTVKIRRRASLLSFTEATVRKRFRRYVQISETNDRIVYFKEFGDPRLIDSDTGEIFPTLEVAQEVAQKAHREFSPATELLTFKISSTRTPYGVPRWIGALLAVLGTRQAEEVNFLYFENRSVPPLAVLVSGGRLNADTVTRLEDYIANQIRGKRNFHKIMILEAESAAGDANAGKMKIVLQPLTEAQQKEGTFQQYDERNTDKVGQAFRLPRLLRGDVRDFNRSTAEASVDFAEIQVFGPIRQQFDWIVNKLIFPALGARHHTFKSNAPTIRDPDALSQMIERLVKVGVLTPGEGRSLSVGVFNREFEKIKEAWTGQPIALTLATAGGAPGGGGLDDFNANGGMSAGGAGATQEALGVDQSKGDLMESDLAAGGAVSAPGYAARRRRRSARVNAIKGASILSRVHAALLKAEREEFLEGAEHIPVPADLFYSWVTPTPAEPEAAAEE